MNEIIEELRGTLNLLRSLPPARATAIAITELESVILRLLSVEMGLL